MDAHNLVWVISSVTWGVIPGWSETIRLIEVISPGLVSKGFLIEPLYCLPLVLQELLWYFTNKQATQGGSFSDIAELPGYYPSFG